MFGSKFHLFLLLRYVLAAAHCVTYESITSVRLGDYNVLESEDCKLQFDVYHCASPVQDFQIESIAGHPQYNREKRIHNIGLIRINRDADLTKASVTPICLPMTPRLMSLELPYYIGTSYDCSEALYRNFEVAYKAKLEFVNLSKCEEMFRKMYDNSGIPVWQYAGTFNRICVVKGTDCKSFHGEYQVKR